MNGEVKNSGINWLGDIPKSWTVGRVKDFYTLQTGFTPDTKNDTYYDDVNGKLWVNISDMGNSHYISETKKKISDWYIEKFKPLIVPKGSLLYSFKLSVGTVAIAGCDLYTNEAIASFLNNDKVNLNYLYYSSQVCIIHNANENIYGAKLLNQDLINNAIIVFPPLSKQHKIAEYLDKVCGDIDEIVALQEQMIEELKAYKQSVITEAVTKGLNPNVPMRNSGIDWIGEIPEGWKILQTKRIVHSHLQGYYDADGYAMSGYRLLRITDLLNDGNLTLKNAPFVKETPKIKDFILQRGDFCFARTGGAGSFGYISDDVEPAVFASYLIRFRFFGQNNNFLRYYFLSYSFISEVNTLIHGGVNKNIHAENIMETHLPIPPILEQSAIAYYLDGKCSEIDSLIAIKQVKIEELKEYKKSIIYEYVTGKKEVV